VDDALRPEPVVEEIRVAHGEAADPRRRLGQGCGDQHVVVFEELRDLPAGGVHDVDRLQIVRPVDGLGVFDRAAGRRLDLVGARLGTACLGAQAHGQRGAAGDHLGPRPHRLLEIEAGFRFHQLVAQFAA
jgi:hypothetical protein